MKALILCLGLAAVGSAFGANLSSACRDSSNAQGFAACWGVQDEAANPRNPCVLVVESNTGTIDESATFCQSESFGLPHWKAGVSACRYQERLLTCNRPSQNPLQEAVKYVANRNRSLGRLQWEAFVEPGLHTVGPKGFTHRVGGVDRPHAFDSRRFAVQITSFTRLRGATLKNGAGEPIPQSHFFITQSTYRSLSRNEYPAESVGYCHDWNASARMGLCVASLLTLTETLDIDATTAHARITGGVAGPYVNDVPQLQHLLADLTEQNPVRDVDIRDLSLWGVDISSATDGALQGPFSEAEKARVDAFDDSQGFCLSDACYYKYTVAKGIEAKSGSGNITINRNRFRRFHAFMMLGHIFLTITDKEGFDRRLKVNGTPAQPVRLRNNFMNHAIGADSLIIWGDHAIIENNTVANGYNNLITQQNAIAVYLDSNNVIVRGNRIENYSGGINMEGALRVSAKRSDWGHLNRESHRIPTNNIVENNVLTDTLTCIGAFRQLNLVVRYNRCGGLTAAHLDRAFDLRQYTLARARKRMEQGKLTDAEMVTKAYENNIDFIGSGLVVIESPKIRVVGNHFDEIPHAVYVVNEDVSPYEFDGGIFRRNVFRLSNATISHMQAYADRPGNPSDYGKLTLGLFHYREGGRVVGGALTKHKVCSDNVFAVQNSKRYYSAEVLTKRLQKWKRYFDDNVPCP